MSVLLEISDLYKNFSGVEVIRGFNLSLNERTLSCLVGPNGAGKTTLLRLIAGTYSPTSGEVTFGKEPLASMRHKLGVVPEATGLYHRLTAWENIRYHSRIHGVEDEVAWNRTVQLAKMLGMEDSLSRHTKGFSKGMRQKTSLIRALAHGPEALLLDEPTAGLDVTSARAVRDLVMKLRDEGGTVIYSTHQLAEARQVCDRIVIIHNGTIRADSSPDELLEITGCDSLEGAYVQLTSDKARTRTEDDTKEGRLAKWWRRLLTSSTPEVSEDE